MKARPYQGVSFRKGVTVAGYVQVAPGLWMGCRAIPSWWHRLWQRVLLGWTYSVERPV